MIADIQKKLYNNFDDIVSKSTIIVKKLDKKKLMYRIEYLFNGKGLGKDHFDNLARKFNAKIINQENGSQTFTHKGITYTYYPKSSGTDGNSFATIFRKYNKDGYIYEEKIRFEKVK